MKKIHLLIGTVLVVVVLLNVKLSTNKDNTNVNLAIFATVAQADGEALTSCINRGGENNGHCVGDGIGNYFCGETSWYLSNDCVKGM